MTQPLFVSAYTPDYEEHARRLMASLDKFGLSAYVAKLKDRGGWHQNCAQKPEVLLQAMDAFPGRSLVWLDADAEVVQYPKLFEERYPMPDLLVHFKGGTELLTGTMFLANEVRVKRLLEAWREACAAKEREWDQRVLRDLLNSERFMSVFVGELPESYCHIFDQPAEGEPVIIHYQASRETRKE